LFPLERFAKRKRARFFWIELGLSRVISSSVLQEMVVETETMELFRDAEILGELPERLEKGNAP
jgi:hypothetical protein